MQQLQLIFSNGAPAPTNYLYEDLATAKTVTLFEDTTNNFNSTVKCIAVEDPDLHWFLQDLYHYAHPGPSLVKMRKRFERDIAHLHSCDYACVQFNSHSNRFNIELVDL